MEVWNYWGIKAWEYYMSLGAFVDGSMGVGSIYA